MSENVQYGYVALLDGNLVGLYATNIPIPQERIESFESEQVEKYGSNADLQFREATSLELEVCHKGFLEESARQVSMN